MSGERAKGVKDPPATLRVAMRAGLSPLGGGFAEPWVLIQKSEAALKERRKPRTVRSQERSGERWNAE